MTAKFFIVCTLLLLDSSIFSNNINCEKNASENKTLQAIVLYGEYGKSYSYVINNLVEYIIIFNTAEDTSSSAVRVNTTVAKKGKNYVENEPVLVVARQQRDILSWQIPLIVETRLGNIPFDNISRLLCPNNVAQKKNQSVIVHESNLFLNNRFTYLNSVDNYEQIISISTASVNNVTVDLTVEPDREFHINDSNVYSVQVSPSQPRYFFYNFHMEKSTERYNFGTVVVQVNSKDSICMMISIQNVSCPVFDLEREVQFEGYWETMTTKGGITLTQKEFPNGFYLVFVVKGDDYECTGVDANETLPESRLKSLSFSIQPSITYTDYKIAVIITVVLVAIFYIIFLGIFCICARRHYRAMTMDTIDEDAIPGSCSTVNTLPPATAVNSPISDDSSLSETDYDTLDDADILKDVYRTKVILSVADLARKNPKVLRKKSNLYLWNVLTVAVFYGMPVIQLVIRYQKAVIETGNQDLCYYNFLCAHPLGFLSDFNHVFSNIGYVALGVLFLILVYRRERMHSDHEFDKNFGIPQHYGLFYAMGCGLIMEGILSGSYHVCPNHYNFQFDSSFMYVMAVLCMVKIYQTRHPDINAKATTTFGILAVAVFLGMVGIMTGSLYFWIIFTIIHILTCFVLTAQIYYMGRWRLNCGIFKRIFMCCAHDCRAGPLNLLKPQYKGRWFLLFIGNICNWGIAAFGLLHHEHDFATHLLAIFMGNTVLYTLFYICMKIIHKERIQLHVLVYLLLTFITWLSSLYFFIHKSISWALTPAQSRMYNHHCVLMEFYDGHDIWHFLSASAMFFSFMLLLTLDDDLSHKHRSQISVF